MKKLMYIMSLLLLSLSVQAANFNESNWYLTIDVTQIRDRIIPLLPNIKKANKHLKIDALVPDSVGQITLYGLSNQDNDVTAVFQGQFDQFSIPDYVSQLMVAANEYDTLVVNANKAYKGRVIEHISATDPDDDFSVYASVVNNRMMVVSFDQTEVKNWIDQHYSDHTFIPNGLITLLVNVESAMAHMGADLSDNHGNFKSTVFQKINRISGSIIDDGANLLIEAAFGTRDEATAKQVEQVVNGLVAINALSNQAAESPILAAVIQKLQVINQGKDLVFSTSIPFDLAIEAMVD